MLRSMNALRSARMQQFARNLATDAKPATTPKPSGGGFFQRMSSFLVGAGLSALASQYYIYNELVEGNAVILKEQKMLEARLKKLEKK
mmetsp:Transcript_15246/g.22331  ORF Transcript_15246/g.22331 Transcript_15246/m.22331 type:complete len:88 (-) Transcript_15246:216-479(-)|eukprot:CAMPEP_0197246996 /NCGR_PEP_ID=MMETSP1429-20130617/25150_1 /TAXON_ID=49237 /ORGANISM="Chaetoceros  sp., Strain UNC1202" /LENGTH=87 /DNA_ID=CAMNT_0042707799 /DNA_START=102 /DNA_END=365 /DNA_ORIENTATION=+